MVRLYAAASRQSVALSPAETAMLDSLKPMLRPQLRKRPTGRPRLSEAALCAASLRKRSPSRRSTDGTASQTVDVLMSLEKSCSQGTSSRPGRSGRAGSAPPTSTRVRGGQSDRRWHSVPVPDPPLPSLHVLPMTFTGGRRCCERSGRKFHTLCYGDDFTFGQYAGGRRFEPYGRALAVALSDLSGGADCVVSVCGVKGRSAAELVANLDMPAMEGDTGPQGKGLQRTLMEGTMPHQLVVIMAGSWDIAQDQDPRAILSNLQRLHGICHAFGLRTVALAPPPSPNALRGLREVDRKCLLSLLEKWAQATPDVLAFVNTAELVPPAVGGHLWDTDGLHLSPAGSQRLGQRLAHVLQPLLRQQRLL